MISGKVIVEGWRVAIFIATIFSALASPAADEVSMLMLADILIVLVSDAAGLSIAR